jgi:hypothetical protein
MKAHPETTIQSNAVPVTLIPALVRIPEWQQFPLEKREELTRILAGMLVKQVQEAGVKHEQPS